jgi:ribosome-binding protein aMBF1 (putative translation factor)
VAQLARSRSIPYYLPFNLMAKKRPAGSGKRASVSRDDLAHKLTLQARKIFGSNLRHARQRAGLRQTDLATVSGVEQYYISKVERGAANVSIDIMTTLARAVGSDLHLLLKPLPPSRQA